MKNFTFILLFLLPLFLKAQLNDWSPTRPLTDSAHNNRNAFLMGSASNALLFWDQELNTTTTQLCYKYFNTEVSDKYVLLFKPNARLTNPKTLYLGQSSNLTDLKVFYQTNEGNDINLQYITLKSDGTISEPSVLSDLPGDDVHMSVDNSGVIAWENSGKIWVSHYLYQSNSFTIPFAVDSVGAYSPVLSGNNTLNYLKHKGDSTLTISFYINLNQEIWEITNAKKHSLLGEASGLTCTQPFGSNLCMENKIGMKNPGLAMFDRWSSEFRYKSSPTYSYSQPAISDFLLLVKSSSNSFLAYVSDSLSNNEIFAESPTWSPGPQNISKWPGDDRNPQFFITYPLFYICSVNLIWESERFGFSTIYSTHYDYLFGGLNNNPKTETLSVNPCPFNRETTIRIHASKDMKVRIFDMKGHKIKMLTFEKDTEGWQKAIWDGTNNNGNQVPPGTYVIVCHTGDAIQSRIIIKN